MVKGRGRPLRRLVAYARPNLSIPSVARAHLKEEINVAAFTDLRHAVGRPHCLPARLAPCAV